MAVEQDHLTQAVDILVVDDSSEQVVDERTSALIESKADLEKELIELEGSEAQFQATFEQAAVGIAHVSTEGRFLRINRKFCDIVGYTRDEMLAMTFQDITHPDDLDADLDHVQRLLAGESDTYCMEKRCFRKDGETVWVNLTVSLLRRPGGEPNWFVSVVEDISERVQAVEELSTYRDRLETLLEERTAQLQEELAERERTERELASQIAFFDVLLDATEDTIEIFDPDDMRYLKWNKRARELAGRSDEEIAVMDPVRDFIAEEDIPATLAAVEQAMVEGRTKVRCTVVSKDGTRTPMEYTGSVPRDADGNPLQFIAIGRDISEQIRIEDALRQSEEMYRDLVEKISDVIYAINMEGLITYLSPAAESLLGFPPEQMVGRPFAQSIHPEDLEQVQEDVQGLLTSEIPGTAEYRVLNALGETRWIRVTSQPNLDGGQVTGLRGVLTDITERKRVEEQLEEAAIAAERQRLARDLHDSVTQTLYSLDLFANAAQEALSKGKIETGREHAQRIRSLSQSALVDMRLLIFELQPPLLEQEGLAGALRARLESVEARAGLTTEFEAMAERPLSPAVESELYAVAREALNNALRHAQADRIIVKLDCDERECCLTIRDDGVGFDLATTERTGGFGLRSMADRAERIGGSLTLDTAPGKGTTVRVEVAA